MPNRRRGAFLLAVSIGLSIAHAAKAQEPTSDLERLERTTRAAVDEVRASVVRISSLREAPEQNGAAEGRAVVAPIVQSIGTGVIVDERGFVLTNAHVVREAQSVTVGLWRTPPVELRGQIFDISEEVDLALVRLAGRGPFRQATIGRSRDLRVGDWVIAVGSPYGLEHSASMGIVSDRSRDLWIRGRKYQNLIQTDAAINQGNSGGPIVDLQGTVVGINTAIYAPDGVSAGVGFAIPVDQAQAYLARVLPPNRNRLVHQAALQSTHPQLLPRPAVAANPHQLPDAKKDVEVIQRASGFFLAASALFNMLGLGGGLVYVPILLFFGVNFHVASAVSLFVITVAHLSALYVFVRSKLVDYKLALALEPVSCIGALIGGLSSEMIGATALSAMFGCLMLVAAIVIHRRPMEAAVVPQLATGRWAWQRSFGAHEYTINLALALPLTLVIGYLGGLLGFAGGWLKIPMLVLLFGMPIKVAIGTSSLMVAVTSLVGCIGHGIEGHFDARLAIVLALMGVVGAQIGARLTVGADTVMLKRIFSVVLLGVALWMI
ncbi:MAG: TSUP family transporter [Deltaproteobacteria bacterium]|nr:TSUP family transporter [Deltaproteobacteria bacterium]